MDEVYEREEQVATTSGASDATGGCLTSQIPSSTFVDKDYDGENPFMVLPPQQWQSMDQEVLRRWESSLKVDI